MRLEADFLLNVDPEIVKRVMVNIVTNAIKFSDPGGHMNLLAETAGPSVAKIIIEDEGKGIPAEHLPFVFDKYFQGSSRRTGYEVSTGIGLTFCKMAVNAHGGEIGAIAGKDRGTSFWFTLPLYGIQNKTSKIKFVLS
ncbi:MAG: ATP-binding protein [Bacteroidales bacterium]|nr:ATP-binding protein [Bacteroidales bacterium]